MSFFAAVVWTTMCKEDCRLGHHHSLLMRQVPGSVHWHNLSYGSSASDRTLCFNQLTESIVPDIRSNDDRFDHGHGSLIDISGERKIKQLMPWTHPLHTALDPPGTTQTDILLY